MIKKIKSGVRYVTDFYRTAPLPETIIVILTTRIPFDYDNLFVCGMDVLLSLMGVGYISKQFELRQRLEESVSEKGYTDRVFEKTIPEWCDRQTARVVARNNGCLEDYVSLCEKHGDRMSFKRVPHI